MSANTPSLAGTAETMTAEMQWATARGFDLKAPHWDDLTPELQEAVRRVVHNATYAALAESQREVERLRLDNEACLIVIADLRAALAAAQEDTRRLGLLAEWAATPLELDRMGGLDGDEPVGPIFLTFSTSEPNTGPEGGVIEGIDQYAAPTLRGVIDKVEAAFAARPHATPEGE